MLKIEEVIVTHFDVDSLVAKARRLCLRGHIDRAASILSEIVDETDSACVDNNCAFFIAKSYIDEFRGVWTEAFVSLRKVLVLSRSLFLPSYELETHGRMATLFAKRGDCSGALFHIEAGDKLNLSSEIEDQSRLVWLLAKSSVLRYCNNLSLAQAACEESVAFAEKLDDDSLIWALFSFGEFYYRLGKLHDAADIYRKIDELLKDSSELNSYKAELVYRQGLMENKGGFIDNSLTDFRHALELYEDVFDSEGVSRCLLALGSGERLLGNNSEALEYYSQCREIRRDTGDSLGYAQVLGEIACVFRNRGELEMALDCYDQSLEIRRRSGDKYGEALILNDLAMVHRYRGDYEQAFTYYKQSLETKQRIGDRFGQAKTLNEYALALKDTGAYKEALEAVEQGIAIGEDINAATLLISLFNNRANILFFNGRSKTALALLKENLHKIETVGCTAEKQVTLGALADIYRAQGDYDEAERMAEESANVASTNNSRRGLAYSHLQMALINADRGIPFAALHDFKVCREIRETMEDAKGLVEVLWREASVEEAVGNTSAALCSYRRAWMMSSSCNFRRTKLISRLGLLALEPSSLNLSAKILEAESLLSLADELEYIDGLFWASFRLAVFYKASGNSVTSLKFLNSAWVYLNKGAWVGGRTKRLELLEEMASSLVDSIEGGETDFVSSLENNSFIDDSSFSELESKESAILCISYPPIGPHGTIIGLDGTIGNGSALDLINQYMNTDRQIVPLIISSGGSLICQFWKIQFVLFRDISKAHSFVKKVEEMAGYETGIAVFSDSRYGIAGFNGTFDKLSSAEMADFSTALNNMK